MRGISVVIAEPTQTERVAYVRQLFSEEGIHVVAQAGTKQDVVEALKLRPHILVLNWEMAGVSEMLLRLVRRDTPGTKVILLINRMGRRQLVHVLSHGARGYLGRALARSSLAKAIRLVDKGDVWVSRAMVPILVAVLSRTALA
ncbi:MAG TPA: response regulator [Nitrospiraceae bacterium]|nr:response regulator [Nitrospiraceae bacterium]